MLVIVQTMVGMVFGSAIVVLLLFCWEFYADQRNQDLNRRNGP
jgi:hypothetical protein